MSAFMFDVSVFVQKLRLVDLKFTNLRTLSKAYD